MNDRWIHHASLSAAKHLVRGYHDACGDDDPNANIIDKIRGWVDGDDRVTPAALLTGLLSALFAVEQRAREAAAEDAWRFAIRDAAEEIARVLDALPVNPPEGLRPVVARIRGLMDDMDTARARSQALEGEVEQLRARIRDLEAAADIEREAIQREHHKNVWQHVLADDDDNNSNEERWRTP